MCNFKYGDIVKVDDGSHDGFFEKIKKSEVFL